MDRPCGSSGGLALEGHVLVHVHGMLHVLVLLCKARLLRTHLQCLLQRMLPLVEPPHYLLRLRVVRAPPRCAMLELQAHLPSKQHAKHRSEPSRRSFSESTVAWGRGSAAGAVVNAAAKGGPSVPAPRSAEAHSPRGWRDPYLVLT